MNTINFKQITTYPIMNNNSFNGLRDDDDIEISIDDEDFEDTGEDWFHYNSSTGKSWTTSQNDNIFDKTETWWKSRDWNKVGQNVVNFFDNIGNKSQPSAPQTFPSGDLPRTQRPPVYNPPQNKPSFFKQHGKKVIGITLVVGASILTIAEIKKAKRKSKS